MKKKGFTLIELLAVLVVLSILALISIPITIRIINSSRENSYKRSIASYAQALENYIAVNNIDNAGNDYDLLYNYVNDSKFNTTYSGNRVECNYDPEVNNNTSKSTLIDGKLILRGCRVVNNAKEKISNHKYRYIDRKVELDVDAYEISNSLFINGELYYVIANSPITQDYVTLLKAEPLFYEDTQTYLEGLDINETVTNKNGYGIVKYGQARNNNNYDKSIMKNIVDAWEKKKFSNNELKSVLINDHGTYTTRLITKGEYESILSYDWRYNSDCSYSTMDNLGDNSVWIIYDEGTINYNKVYYQYCVRPVINVYKDKITQED